MLFSCLTLVDCLLTHTPGPPIYTIVAVSMDRAAIFLRQAVRMYIAADYLGIPDLCTAINKALGYFPSHAEFYKAEDVSMDFLEAVALACSVSGTGKMDLMAALRSAIRSEDEDDTDFCGSPWEVSESEVVEKA